MGFKMRYKNGICPICRKNQLRKKARNFDGSIKYGNTCDSCHRNKYHKYYGTYRYKKHQKFNCEVCGFIPIDDFQLEVHHMDGNHKNDSNDNIQIVCANCHKLLTKQLFIEKLKRRE
jgi:hypothetical protein